MLIAGLAGPAAAAERFLGPTVATFLDVTGQLGIDEVAGGGVVFTPADGRVPNLGVAPSPRAAFWIRAEIPSLAEPADLLAISIQEPRIRRAWLYLPTPGTEAGGFVERAWSRAGAAERPEDSLRYPVFAVGRTEVEGKTVYLRVETGSSLRATVWLDTARSFTASYGRQALLFGLLLGALSGLTVYLAAIGTALGDRSLITLGCVSLAFSIYVAADQGFLETVLWPGAEMPARVLSLTSTLLLLAAWIGFAASYLRVAVHRPLLGKAAAIAILALCLFALEAALEIMAGLRIMRRLSPYLGLAALAFGFMLPVVVIGRERRRAVLFLACWSPAVAGGAARLALDAVPALGASTIASHAVYVGAGFSILVFGIIASFDIQARERRLREEAQSKELRLRDFAGIASDSFWEVSPEGRVLFASGPATFSLGLSAGSNFFERLARSAHADTRAAAGAVSRAMAEAATVRSVPLTVTEAGQQRHLLLSGAPAANGSFRGTVADVTSERDRLDREALQQKMAALGQLAGGMAHELNNLLHPVINLGRRLRDRFAPDREEHRQLGIIVDAGQRAGEIVAGVLTTVRPGMISGKPVDIDEAVRRSVEAIRPAVPASVTLDLSLDAEGLGRLPPGEVLQVLSNLAANAMQAIAGAGRIAIATRPDAEGGAVVLTVSDDGEGMDEPTRLRAAEPFFTTRSPASGTGLGLPIVFGVVRGWGGTIDLLSEPGLGTTVAITIPSNRPEDPAARSLP